MSSSSTTQLNEKGTSPSSTRPELRRPAHAPYHLTSLVNIPRRLFRRNATFKDSESSIGGGSPTLEHPKRFGNATAGVVRSPGLTRVKLRDVTLEDMYRKTYTPPITIKEFEDFLAFKERSVENLYFDVWMREYSSAWERYTAATQTVSSERLLALYSTGRTTFLNPDSPLELNVRSDIRKTFDESANNLPSGQFLPPSAFSGIHGEVEASLHRSLSSFFTFVSGNADTNRGWFAKIVGIATFILGFVPVIVCSLMNQSRAWRALGIPLWLLGAVVFVGGYRRTCLIIFLFGDRRQLYPWELIRPSLEDAPSSPGSPSERGRTATTDAPFDATGSFSSDGKSDNKLDLYNSPDPSVHTHQRSRSSSSHSFDFSELGLAHVPSILLSPSIASRDPSVLYFAPEHLAPKLKRSSPTFASLTKVLEPLVIESQREIVFAGAMYAVIATCLASAISFSVPNKH